MHVVRLRLTDEMRVEIRRYMSLDDRESFDETVRHLLRVGLHTKLGSARNGLVVERAEPTCNGTHENGWNGNERRRSTRENAAKGTK